MKPMVFVLLPPGKFGTEPAMDFGDRPGWARYMSLIARKSYSSNHGKIFDLQQGKLWKSSSHDNFMNADGRHTIIST